MVPSISGPRRPQDRIALTESKKAFAEALPSLMKTKDAAKTVAVQLNGDKFDLKHGSVVISAITSCTNTSNPSVLIGAGLLGQESRREGAHAQTLGENQLGAGIASGHRVFKGQRLVAAFGKDRFSTLSATVARLVSATAGRCRRRWPTAFKRAIWSPPRCLSGNRNFEGRIHANVRANYLASPPLVVAYALAGSMDVDLYNDPLGNDSSGKPVYLKDIWPTPQEVQEVMNKSVRQEMFKKEYSQATEGDARWKGMPVPQGELFKWDMQSTYVREAPYFDGMGKTPNAIKPITGARALALLGDSVTTDHISPAGSIEKNGPAARYLTNNDVLPKDYNQYGARRGNHEVMMRGTFANIRLKNMLGAGHRRRRDGAPAGQEADVDLRRGDAVSKGRHAADRHRRQGIRHRLVARLGGQGTASARHSSAAIAESFERIHRSNLIGMGIVPLVFKPGENLARRMGSPVSKSSIFSVSART